MDGRKYYSLRTGKNPRAQKFDLEMLKRLFRDEYLALLREGYFQEAFGYHCVDDGDVPGALGSDIEAQMFRSLRKPSLWPIQDKCPEYSEDDLFDVIEFLFDHVSKPLEGRFHSFLGCGWHYYTFDKGAGQQHFRERINEILRDYETGYELSAQGEILQSAQEGLEDLVEAHLPEYDPENVEDRVYAAARKFRRYNATQDEKRDAVRDLADVLEFLRKKLEKVLTDADERDLFELANRFGIRHHRSDQKTDYDKAIWYDWMFYYYLSTIHACLRLIKREGIEDE